MFEKKKKQYKTTVQKTKQLSCRKGQFNGLLLVIVLSCLWGEEIPG